MKWGNIGLFLVVLVMSLALLPMAHAFDFKLSSDSVAVSAGDTASVEVLMSSNIDDFLVFSIDNMPSWATIPTNIPVLSSEPSKATIYFAPYNSTKPTLYKMVVRLESLKTGQITSKNLTVIVKKSNVAIEDISASGDLIPNGNVTLTFYIKNYENKKVGIEVSYKVTSPEGSNILTSSDILTFDPKEFKPVDKYFIIPECSKAGSYKVHADVIEGENILYTIDDDFNVESRFSTDVKKVQKTELFKTTTIITVKNTGNVPGKAIVSEDVWGSLFFSGDTPNSSNETYTWSVPLDVCETKLVKYSIDYSPIPIALIAALALFYIIFRLRTVGMRKYIIQKKMVEKGEQFTVGIEFKSHSNVNNVEIRDFIPSVFKVVDSGKATRHTTEAGTELIWKFHELKRGEERIVSYKIVPLFSVTGSVKLPRASISFRYLGKSTTKKTERVYIGIDERDEGGFSFKDIHKHITGKKRRK
ncbi:MAG: hypothetical protein HY831_03010 [Candidatus Aenigmarchaeota archaeon]|nr:hypothetical protein [Candidatus Aenigmarchaeota archaeon]